MSKTYKKPFVLYHTITTAEASANTASISVLTTAISNDLAWICQIQRAGVEIPGFYSAYASGNLTVSDAGSASLTTDDEVVVFATFK
jgi:hypothetical protein